MTKKFMIFHNNPQSLLYYSEIILEYNWLYSRSNKTNGIKIGLQLTANSRTPVELKNCKLENTSLLFGPLTQYLGSDKRRFLSPFVTFTFTFCIHSTVSAKGQTVCSCCQVGQWLECGVCCRV